MTKSNSLLKRTLALILSLVFAISSFTVAGFSAMTALADDGDYYMFAYFTGNEDTRQYDNSNQAIRFAVSTDGINFKALNDNKPAIEQLGGSLNVRDPYLFKGADEYYYIIGTDLDCITMGWWGNQPQMVIWRSLDLVNWTDETYINTAQICGLNDNQVYRTWAPEVFYDEITGKYMVYFAFAADGYSSTRMHYMLTDDLLDQSHYSKPAVLYDPGYDDIDSDIIKQGDTYYMFYKDETPGRSSVCLATASTLTGPYTFIGQFATTTETGGIEGCEVYTIGNNYYLVADRFGAAGRFAIYNLGSNLAAVAAASDGTNISVSDGNPISTVDGLNGFENLSVRHGSIMHINKTQYDALIAKYGISDKDDIKFVFDRAYTAENSWHYDTIKDASGYNFSLMTNTGGYSYVHSQSNCVAINGATMFIQDGDIKNMFDTGKSWTVSFNANIVLKRGAPLFALTSGAEANGVNSKDWIRFLDNGDFYINNGSEYVKKGSTDITTTTDYDFDITYNGTDITLYKDGVKQFTSNIGTLGFDKNGVTSYTAWGWTDTCGVTGVNASYTNIRFRSKAITAAQVANEYTDNLIYQYNEGTHEAIDGRANVTYNSPKTSTTYTGKRGASFAVSGWVNIGAQKHTDSVLFEFGEGGTGNGKNYLSLLEDGTVKWCWSEGSTPRYVDIASIYDFAENTYYYVQINIIPDGSQYHFQAFVNGESTRDVTSGYNSMQTQAYGPTNFLSSNRALNFGQGNAYWTTAGYNIIDDIRVYNRAVDAAANYEKVCLDDAAADARTYVRANLDGYDVTEHKANRNAYHYADVATGGFNSVLASSYNDTTCNNVWDNNNAKYNDVHYAVFYPTNIALMYDGVNTPALPTQLEMHCYADGRVLPTVYCSDGGFGDGHRNTSFQLAYYWTGYQSTYTTWSGTSMPLSANHKEYPSNSDGKDVYEADGYSHIGYYAGATWDYNFSIPRGEGTGQFFWNKLNYIGSGDTNTYLETFTTTPMKVYQGGDFAIPDCNHNVYVVNYKPIYDILKDSIATAVPNAGGLGLKAVYDNLVKDNESNWTTDSLNQFYVAAYKVLKANPMEYSEATYQADFSGTANKAASNIKDAVSEFNKINLQARADFSDLEDAVADATDILDNSAENYTAASIAALQDAVDAVTYTAYDADERANMAADLYQNDIEDEETAIREAIAALIEKKSVTFVEFGGASTTVKYDPGTAAATVEADAPALPSDNYDSVANKHYTYAWDNAFADVTANATYTQVRSEVAHVYGSFAHVNGTNTHTATCTVNGQSHTDTFDCEFESQFFDVDGDTNSFTRYTCKDCGYSYDGDYGAQDWTAYDAAVAAYDAAVTADFDAKYTEASRTAFNAAASNKLTKADTVSQSAINTATTSLENAVSGLAIQNYTITYKYWGVATTASAVLPYSASAEDVAAEAPENTATNYNEERHYTFAWEAFSAVTGNKTYNEERTSTVHSYTPVHTNADGDANGYTTYTCECGRSYVEYDAQDWTAYDAAVLAYDTKAAEADFNTKYTAATREAFAAAADAKFDSKAQTISQSAIDNAVTTLNNAVSGLIEEETPDNGYSLTLDDHIDVNFFVDTEFYDAEDGYIEYTFLANTNDKSAARDTFTIQDEELTEDQDGRRVLSVKVAPAQLAEKFQINVYDKYGNKKNDEAIETSIADYCEALLGIEAYSAYHDVARTLLDYGALADEYFGYAALSKAETGIDYEVPHSAGYKDAVDAESFKSLAKASVVNGVDESGQPVYVTSVSYIALVDPEFRFYVNQENDVWCYYTDISISDPDLEVEWGKTEGRGNFVRVKGLKASDFGKTFTITIGTYEITYNGYAFLYTVLREGSTVDQPMKYLAQGIYRYAVACNEKFNS